MEGRSFGSLCGAASHPGVRAVCLWLGSGTARDALAPRSEHRTHPSVDMTMRTSLLALLLTACIAGAANSTIRAQSITDTRLLSQPAVSAVVAAWPITTSTFYGVRW